MTIRVGIADDQALVRSGFASILGASEDIEVVGEAGNGHEAVTLAMSKPLDVLLMDIRMPGLDGIQATRDVMAKVAVPPRVCILTMFDTDELVYSALVAGASGFLLKDSTPDELRSAVRTIADGSALFGPSALRSLVDACKQQSVLGDRERFASLTPREREILGLVAAGNNNAEIAAELNVAESTVKTHFGRLLAKLGVRDRVHAVLFAHGHDL